MLVRAHLRYLRIAPRKVRLVIDLVRGMTVERAFDQLSVLPKRSTLPVTKLIQSAVANATHNNQLDPKTLVIKAITANEGPKLKRFIPKAFGRANPILKRTTHITVILEGQELKGAKPLAKDTAKPETVDLTTVKKSPAKKPAPAKAPSRLKKTASGGAEQKHAAVDASVKRQGTE